MGDTTTNPRQADAAEPDYRAKYDGLSGAFQQRSNEWTQKEQDYEARLAELTAKAEKLAGYEAREIQEAEAQAFEDRLMADPRMNPQRHNSARSAPAKDDGSAAYLLDKLAKGNDDTGRGWPV